MAEEKQFDAVYGQVKKVIAEVFNTEEEELTLETNLQTDLAAESLDIVTLLMEFEDTFDRQIPEEDVEKLLTIGDAVNYILSFENKAE